MDISSSTSCCYEEDEYPIREVRTDCNMKGKRTGAWDSCKVALLRSVLVVALFCALSHNLRSRFPQSGVDHASLFEDRDFEESSAIVIPRKPSKEELMQQESKSAVLQKFGRGPLLVEFHLQIWGELDNRPTDHFFTVELASPELVPVTTHYFLEQVSKGLWSGTSFHINAEHVIMARPVNGNGQHSKRAEFAESEYGTLPFIEYSPLYPHLPFTLGFTAPTQNQPSSIYINKKYNPQHAREACFAQVVVGRSTIEKLAQLQGYAHDPTRIRPVDIIAVRQVSLEKLSETATKEYLTIKSAQVSFG